MASAYEEIVNKIENMRRFGKKTGYEISKDLLSYLDYPEMNYEIIHIAGTNGKGSTAMYSASILSTKYKVGLFTSPHLISFRERIQIGTDTAFEMIHQSDVVRLGTLVLDICAKHDLEPTMFDITLAMALLYFKEQECDYVVLETGLGGRFDSTRAVSKVPVVSVFTNIGFDHEAILGDTLTEIAHNKAGILQNGTQAVIGEMDKEARETIIRDCETKSVPFIFADEVPGDDLLSLRLSPYQIENAKNAIAAVRLLEEEFDTFNGLKRAKWPGRMDVISKNPFIMVDGAHNPQGVAALKKGLKTFYPDEKFTFIVGVLADKDYVSMMEQMVSVATRFLTVTVDSARALDGEELAKTISSYGVSAEVYDKIENAISDAKKQKEKIVIFGSLYFIGEVLELFKEK